jgi:hypothetical protein
MDQPWYFVGLGLAVSLVAGAVTYMGLDVDMTAMVLAGWVLGFLGGVTLVAGVIAVGVEVGVRAADR